MQGDAHRAFRHGQALRSFADRDAVHRNRLHHVTLTWRQCLQMPRHVAADAAVIRLRRGQHLGKGIDVLADVVLNPTFQEEEIARVREQRLSSILQGKDDAGNLSDKKFNKVVFGEHPYAFPSEGTEESVKALTKIDFETFCFKIIFIILFDKSVSYVSHLYLSSKSQLYEYPL